jgi:hypothetical protein
MTSPTDPPRESLAHRLSRLGSSGHIKVTKGPWREAATADEPTPDEAASGALVSDLAGVLDVEAGLREVLTDGAHRVHWTPPPPGSVASYRKLTGPQDGER